MKVVRYVIISVLLVIVQTSLIHLLTLEGVTPDILTIWVVYLAVREGQLRGTVWGFAVGLLFDVVSGGFFGLSALTKTVSGFCAGYFYNENKTPLTLSSYRFLVIVLIVSMIHNTLYFLIDTQGSDVGLIRAIFQVGVATTFYTTIWTLVPMFAFARKYIA